MIWTWPVPSGFMVHTSAAVKAPFVKAILSPTGDHTGCSSTLGPVLVRFVTPEPSAFILKISSSKLTAVWNRMWVPFGDQSGSISIRSVAVSITRPVPFGATVAMSPSREKAILAPSGDQDG